MLPTTYFRSKDINELPPLVGRRYFMSIETKSQNDYAHIRKIDFKNNDCNKRALHNDKGVKPSRRLKYLKMCMHPAQESQDT